MCFIQSSAVNDDDCFGSLVVLPLLCLFKLQFVAVCSLWMQLCVKSSLGKWSHFRKMLISRSVSAAPVYQPTFSGRGRLSTLQTLLLMRYLFWTHRVPLWLLSLHLRCLCDTCRSSGKDVTLHVFFLFFFQMGVHKLKSATQRAFVWMHTTILPIWIYA